MPCRRAFGDRRIRSPHDQANVSSRVKSLGAGITLLLVRKEPSLMLSDYYHSACAVQLLFLCRLVSAICWHNSI
jgi:hypothetical protein